MSGNANNSFVNFLTIVTLIASAITAVIQCTDKGREFWQGITDEPESGVGNSVNLSGDWKMTFDFARCSNPEFANRGFECYYNLTIFQNGVEVSGNGVKHSEKIDGKVTKYSHDFPLRIEGKIKNSELIANLYEKNSKNEVTGTIKIDLNKKWIFKGIYTASGENCNGNIVMERVLPTPSNPNVQKK
jgi:hypothetical protein